MSDATSYDSVAYPPATFPQTHPDRLAVIAWLHGLSAPAVDTARVLEIGGGDGFNLIAQAAAYPHARFFNFDLSAAAIARGSELAAGAGLANIRIEQADIIDMAATIGPASYDYIIAHGVYAWVSAPVRAAIVTLVGRALAPDGLFFVSYNALPGGHVRQVMRDMLLHALADVHGIDARIKAARAFLEDHARAREGDDAVVTAMRSQAVAMLDRPDAVLFHDELGDCFAPQNLSDVVAAAAMHGLEFLNDSGKNRLGDGFLPEYEIATPDPTAVVVRRAQSDDFAAMRFFRQNLFIRARRRPARRPQPAQWRSCHVAGQFAAADDGSISVGDVNLALSDSELSRRLLDLGAAWPVHQPLSAIAATDDQLEAIHRLFAMGLLHVSTVPPPFALIPPERAIVSPLVRGQITLGMAAVTTLHFEQMRIDDPAARALLSLLDGTRDRSALTKEWERIPHDPSISLEIALNMIAQQRLILASS